MPEGTGPTETAYTLHQAWRLLDALEQCMLDRLRPGRSGWSAAVHLGHDLERFFGVRAPVSAIERALGELGKYRGARLRLDGTGALGSRIRPG